MKAAMRYPAPAVALSLLAALAVVLVAWLVPLPRLVLGEEEAAAGRMPQTRADVTLAQSSFEQAESNYKAYVSSHDVGAALNALDTALASLQSDAGNPQKLAALQTASQPVRDYAARLQAYAAAGESYFAQVKHYDDELMAWTRSLGADSETLRPDTWPIVEYLKLYPPPVGENTAYDNVTASHVADLAAALDASKLTSTDSEALGRYASAIAGLRAAGRSVVYIESLHSHYFTLLQGYDSKLQAVASGGGAANLSGGRMLLATATNTLLGLALVAGLAAIFLPGFRKEKGVVN
jgi:hypothetical protein